MKRTLIQFRFYNSNSPVIYFARIVFMGLFLIFFTNPTQGRDDDSTGSSKKERRFKNVVRFNLTNPMIFGSQSLFVGYERTIGKHQSFSVNVGRPSYPKLVNFSFTSKDTSIQLLQNYSDRGFCSTLDYRFYLKKENKFLSPHGVYIGPYASFTYFERVNSWSLVTNNFTGVLNTTIKLNINIIGFQLGYQFMVWKRLAIDCILFGPGMGTYKVTANTSTSLDAKEQGELLQKLNDALADRFPLYSSIISGEEFVKTGSFNTTNLGFRYVIHLGFSF